LKLHYLHRALISVLNAVGVERRDDWRGCGARYVCGLGPSIAVNSNSRAELRSELGQVPFRNAAGFILFPESPDRLDRTRIHPEDYPLAIKDPPGRL